MTGCKVTWLPVDIQWNQPVLWVRGSLSDDCDATPWSSMDAIHYMAKLLLNTGDKIKSVFYTESLANYN
jgi:hypothetical protein